MQRFHSWGSLEGRAGMKTLFGNTFCCKGLFGF
jgi:hypothetical protein